MVTVSEIAILRTMLFLWERLKIVVEPTGVLAAAALLEGVISVPNTRIGVILSGGNVDLKQAGKFFTKASAQEKPERLFPLSQELS
jgi:threonine dehydratase